jgi:hypothetical protein
MASSSVAGECTIQTGHTTLDLEDLAARSAILPALRWSVEAGPGSAWMLRDSARRTSPHRPTVAARVAAAVLIPRFCPTQPPDAACPYRIATAQPPYCRRVRRHGCPPTRYLAKGTSMTCSRVPFEIVSEQFYGRIHLAFSS